MQLKLYLISFVFVLLIFFKISNPCYGQNSSNPIVIKNLTEIKLMDYSSEKIAQLIRYSRNPQLLNYDETKLVLEETLKEANQVKDIDAVTLIISTLAILELDKGNQDLAFKYIRQAERNLDRVADRLVLNVYIDISRIYNRTGDIQNAILTQKKIEAFTKDKPNFIIQRILNARNIGNSYFRIGNPELTISNYDLALKLAETSDNQSILKDTRFSYAAILINLDREKEAFIIIKELIPDLDNFLMDKTPQFFNILAKNYEDVGDYRNAFIYTEKEFKSANLSKQRKSNSINKMILLAYYLGDYSNFDYYFDEHKKLGADLNDFYATKQYLLAEARYYEVKGNHDLSKINYYKTFNLQKKNSQSPVLDIESLIGLANIYTKEGNKDSSSILLKKADLLFKKYPIRPSIKLLYTNALKKSIALNTIERDSLIKNLELEIQLKDTLHQLSLNKIANELATKYKVTEKEKELQLTKKQQQFQVLEIKAQKQKTWLIIISASIITLIFFFITYISYQRKKQAKNLHQAILASLKSQHRVDIMNTLTAAQENEKKRIAERLHDEVGAMLSIAKLNLNTLQSEVFRTGNGAESKLEVTKNLMTDISNTVRNISHTLMPIALDKYGLKPAILDLIESIKTANTIIIEHIVEGLDETNNWPQNFVLSTYRIIQELLNNAIKHAEATHLFIQIIELNTTITIYIEDNGKGIDLEQRNNGAGIKLLETNITYLSGKLEIKGEPNNGTFALIELPIPKIDLP